MLTHSSAARDVQPSPDGPGRAPKISPWQGTQPAWLTYQVLVAALLVSPFSRFGAAALAVGAVWTTVRRSLRGMTSILVLTSLAVGTSLGPLRAADAILFSVVVGMTLRVPQHPGLHKRGVSESVVLRLASAVAVLALDIFWVLVSPPATRQGSFVAYEEAILMAGAAVTCLAARRTEGMRGPAHSIVIVAVAASISSLTKVAGAGKAYYLTRQITSVYGGSNYVAALCAVAATLLLHSLLRRTLPRVMWVFFLLLFATPIILASRTEFIVSATAVILLVLANLRRRLGLALVAAGAAGALVLTFGNELITRLEVQDLGTSGRTTLWSHAFSAFRDHLLLGVGPGHLADSYLVAGTVAYYPHNLILAGFAQYGILVGTLFVVALVPAASLNLRSAYGWATWVIVIISLVEPAIDTLRLGLVGIAVTALSMEDTNLDAFVRYQSRTSGHHISRSHRGITAMPYFASRSFGASTRD